MSSTSRLRTSCFVFFLVPTVLAFTALAAHAQQPTAAHPLPRRLVADYGYWSKYQTPPYSAAQIPYHKLTHIIHAGLNINSDGTLSVPQGFLEPELISKAHEAGVKVMVLLGGDASVFSAVAADRGLLYALANNLWNFVSENGYDGVDIDWEYPADSDRQGYVDLFQILRATFPPNYLFSGDVAPWGGTGYNPVNVGKIVDFLNIMMFDCAGPWTVDAQLNSPIFWDYSDTDPWECQPGGSAQEAADIYLKVIPADKLNMSNPFYGYYYTNASALWGPCTDCENTVLTENYGTFIKQHINRRGWQTYYDPVALVPYMLRTDGGPGFITYDDYFSTFTRTWYSLWGRHLGGTWMWSLDADYDGHSQDLLNAMYAATLSGR